MPNFNPSYNNIYSRNSDSESNGDSITETNTDYDEYSNTEYHNGLTYENSNKNRIVLCELFNPLIHGYDFNSDPNIITHYISIDSFNITEFYPNEYGEVEIEVVAQLHNAKYEALFDTISNNTIIRNYSNIISKPDYIKPEIASCLILRGNEMVVIIKTFWLRLIQRTWKNTYKNKQIILEKRSNMASILHRRTTGKWPNDCNKLPTIKGMLYYLNN
jgi:hypothetical protein